MENKSILFVQKQIIAEFKSAGISSAEIDARILIEFVSGKSREFLLANPEYRLKNREAEELKNLIKKRKKHEPIAYITGQKEFFGLDFIVTPDVLIPRPETEILVEEGLKFLELRIMNRELWAEKKLRIIDIGTGSGNIIISIAKYIINNPLRFESIASNLTFFSSDISSKVLITARKNAEKHQVKKIIKFIRSDLFDQISGKFDLIITNLPYVPQENKKTSGGKNYRFGPIRPNRCYPEEIDFEPESAIFADDNGTAIIKKFLDQAQKYIEKNGLILAEIDPRNAKELKNHASELYKSVELKKDFSGIYRVLKILT